MHSSTTACPQCALEFSGGEIFCPVDGARLMSLSSASDHGSSGFGPDPLLNQTLAGRYRILRRIGEGGMGIVYEAVHVIIEKRVALKVLREDFSHREDVVERFRQEAKSASRIGHEHIIDISDFGVTPSGAHFFVMEFLQGKDLAEELEQRGPLPTRRAVGIALQCAKALGAAHAKGIVHRDMKPENIFLVQRDTGEDFVKIVDFGIAKMSDIETGSVPGVSGRKLTKTGMIFGTPEYMSPEHAAGKALDHRVDIYAMGIILYELLTGRVPFMGDTFMGILTQHMFEQVPPLRTVNPSSSASPELEQLILRAVSKNAADRQQSMDELAQALQAVLQFQSPSSSSLPPPGTLTHVDRPAPMLSSTPPSYVSQAAPTRLGSYAGDTAFPGEDEPLPRTSSTRLWLALVGILGAGVVGALLLWKPAPAPVQSPPPPPAVEPSAAVTSQQANVAAVAEPVRPVPQLTPDVMVEVLSEPKGASVRVAGGSGCEPTPCRFHAQRGSSLTLSVEKAGYKTGSAELTPEHDLNQVQLTLHKKRERGHGGVRMEGDLMLPDAFGKR